MVSWRAKIISWGLRLTRKRHYSSVEGVRRGISKTRANPANFNPPASFHKRFIIEERRIHGYPVFTLSPKVAVHEKLRVLFLHGGAFVFEITPHHWSFVALLAERLQAEVTVPIYPLGPEQKLDEQYRFLQSIYYDMAASKGGSPFFVVGDSAGACQAIVLTQEALRSRNKIASGLVLITPIVDATMTNPEAHKLSKRDPWLSIVGVREYMKLVQGDWSLDDPRMSPLFGSADRLPPMFIMTAENDILSPDTRRFVEKAEMMGREVLHIEGIGMMHVWPLVLPSHDGKVVIEKMLEWIKDVNKIATQAPLCD